MIIGFSAHSVPLWAKFQLFYSIWLFYPGAVFKVLGHRPACRVSVVWRDESFAGDTSSTPWMPEVVDRRVQLLPLNFCIGINLSHSEPSHVWWLSSGLGLSMCSGVLVFFFLQWDYLLIEGSYQRNPYKTAALLKILATKQSKIHLRMLHTIPAMFSVHLSSTFILCCFSELLCKLLVQFSPSKLLYHSFNLEVLSWAVIWNFITKRFFGYRTFTFIISILFLNAWKDWYINRICATPSEI